MLVYTINTAIVFVFSFLADRFSYRSSALNAEGRNKAYIWLVLFAVLSLSLVSGLRFMVGTDYVNYSISYEDIRVNLAAASERHQLEYGYLLLAYVFGLFFNTPFVFFFFLAFITNLLFILSIRECSTIFWLSCVLYILMFFYFATFNLVRQSLAASIVFFANKHLLKKEMVKYFVYIIAASLFHTSALLLIPVYFIVHRPAWSLLIVSGFAFVILFFVFYDTIMNVLFAALSHTKYFVYQDLMTQASDGSNILRIAVSSLPVLLSLIFKKKIEEKSQHANVIINMSAINLMVTLLSLKQIYFARITLYFLIYYVFLIPLFGDIFKDKRTRFCVGGVILLCYLAYCYVLLPKEAGVLPYQSIFSAPKEWNIMDYIFSR